MARGSSIRHPKGHWPRVSSGHASFLSTSSSCLYLFCLTLSLPALFPLTGSRSLLVQPVALCRPHHRLRAGLLCLLAVKEALMAKVLAGITMSIDQPDRLHAREAGSLPNMG